MLGHDYSLPLPSNYRHCVFELLNVSLNKLHVATVLGEERSLGDNSVRYCDIRLRGVRLGFESRQSQCLFSSLPGLDLH